MESLLNAIVWETVGVFYEASVYLLIGFFVAGLLHVYLPADLIARHLGRNDTRSVGLAALFGAPIPLCSCGVLPAAASLKRQGAGRAPLVSFLISTPETGVDSVALTYGLMGPVMAVVRPVVAVVTALVAGIASIGVRED
ncbi:MAG: permease, partial [Deltaproteobacteria bacterium]|nr:permease [Deltaproteobacteria bacterium]